MLNSVLTSAAAYASTKSCQCTEVLQLHHQLRISAKQYDIYSHTDNACDQTNRSSGDDNGERSSQRPTSHSSVTTTDFFPTNPHEHSFNKYMSRKASAAHRLSMEANPCTPMRDPHSGVVSPMTDQLHPPAPPVSPAAHYGVPPHLLANSPEDMRLSSFLRDTARVPAHPAEEHIPQHVSSFFSGGFQPALPCFVPSCH